MPSVKDVSRGIISLLATYDTECTKQLSTPADSNTTATAATAASPEADKFVLRFLDSPEFYQHVEVLENYARQHPAIAGPVTFPTAALAPDAAHEAPASSHASGIEHPVLRAKLLASTVAEDSESPEYLSAGDRPEAAACSMSTSSLRRSQNNHSQATAAISNVSAIATPRNLSPHTDQLGAWGSTSGPTSPSKHVTTPAPATRERPASDHMESLAAALSSTVHHHHPLTSQLSPHGSPLLTATTSRHLHSNSGIQLRTGRPSDPELNSSASLTNLTKAAGRTSELIYQDALRRTADDGGDAYVLSTELLQMFKTTILPLLYNGSEQLDSRLATLLRSGRAGEAASTPPAIATSVASPSRATSSSSVTSIPPKSGQVTSAPVGVKEMVVVNNSPLDKTVIFFRAFSHLLPAIGGQRFMLDWWENVFIPILALPNNQRILEIECRNIILKALQPPALAPADRSGAGQPATVVGSFTEKDPDNSSHHRLSSSRDQDWARALCRALVHHYATTCNEDVGYTPSLEALQLSRWAGNGGESPAAPPPLGEKSRLVVNLERILVPFGLANPHVLYDTFNDIIAQEPDLTFVALKFLSEFASQSQANKDALVDADLLESVLNLMVTTQSFEVMEVATNLLIFTLPYFGRRLPAYLPRLLFLLGRRLCWPHDDLAFSTARGDLARAYRFCPLSLGTIILFSYLYGPCPYNTVAFLKAPATYIHGWVRGTKLGDGMRARYDPEPFQSMGFLKQAEQLLRTHVYHPNFLLQSFQVVIRTTSADGKGEDRGDDEEATDDSPDKDDAIPSEQPSSAGPARPPFVVSPHDNDISVVNQMALPEYTELQNYGADQGASVDPSKFIERCLNLQVDIVRKEWAAYFSQRRVRDPLKTGMTAVESSTAVDRGASVMSSSPASAYATTSPAVTPASTSGEGDRPGLARVDTGGLTMGGGASTSSPAAVVYQVTDRGLPPLSETGATDAAYQLATNVVHSYEYCVAASARDPLLASHTSSNQSSQTSLSQTGAAGAKPTADQANLYRLTNQLELERYIADCRMEQLSLMQSQRTMRANAEMAEPVYMEKARYLMASLGELQRRHKDSAHHDFDIHQSTLQHDRRQFDLARQNREELSKRNADLVRLTERVRQLETQVVTYRTQADEATTANFLLRSKLDVNHVNSETVARHREEIDKLTALLMVAKNSLERKDALEVQYDRLRGTAQLLQTQVDAGSCTADQLRDQLATASTRADALAHELQQLQGVHAHCSEQREAVRASLTGQLATRAAELEHHLAQLERVVEQNNELRNRMLELECQLGSVNLAAGNSEAVAAVTATSGTPV